MKDSVRVGLIIPLQGPAGILGPSCEAVAATALRALNAGGILGREVEVEVIDGGAGPQRVAARVKALADAGRVDAVTGWHISAVRETVAPVVAGWIPYAYTAIYEGGESRPGVFCTGETPDQQVEPALRWLRDELGVRRWYVVGDDYIWPRGSVAATRAFARDLGLELCGLSYVPLGTTDYSTVLDLLDTSDAQGVLLYLVGQDAVHFNRMFAARGLQDRFVRFTSLMGENVLLGSGAEATDNIFVTGSYFRSLSTPSALQLCADYVADHGPEAPPLNNAAESCYEGLMTLATLAERAGSLEVGPMLRVADGLGYDGPRGSMAMLGSHCRQPVHLAAARGYDFDVIRAL